MMLIASAVIAASTTWGPFLIAAIYPTIRSAAQDSETNYLGASNIARAVMNISVQNIKKGDFIRVVYPDGKIYDFKTTIRCAYAASVACLLEEPIEMTTKDQKHVNIDRYIDDYSERTGRDICDTAGNQTSLIATGYYGSESTVDGDVITVVGSYHNTGFVEVNRGELGCR